MHLYFYGFSDETFHVAGFCGKEFDFLQSDNVVLIEAVFIDCRFVRLGQSDVPPMLFYPKLDGPYALSDVNLAAFTVSCIYLVFFIPVRPWAVARIWIFTWVLWRHF